MEPPRSSTEDTAGCLRRSSYCTTYRPACDGKRLILITLYPDGGEERGREMSESTCALFSFQISSFACKEAVRMQMLDVSVHSETP